MRGIAGGKIDECRGDLLARERRGELSGPDCLALRAHLVQCESCRFARDVFVDLDQVSGVDLHDGSRIAKMATTARRWGDQRSRPRVRLWPRTWAARVPVRTLSFAAIVLLIGGTASATAWWFRQPHPAPAAKVASRESIDQPVAGARRRPHAVPATAAPAAEPAAQMPGRPIAMVAPRAPARPAPPDAAVSSSALLRQAREARRSGDVERAIGLYRRLQRTFPRSPEATLSAVSLGGLLLDRHLPRAALTQFDGYLVASKGGVLIPEALYGRGRALGALGDRQEERRSWERLLADFPDSAYAPVARRRLQELR
jgi:TolA-binding protein